jgi:hypothetical protein
MLPTSELHTVNMDPAAPVPYTGDGVLLADLTTEAIERMVDSFVGSPLLHVEARHLGGATAIRSPDHGVLDAMDEPFVVFTFGLTADADGFAAVDRHARLLLEALGPWDSGRRYLNFAESRVDPSSIFPPDALERLRAAKARYDPDDRFSVNHPV